jgi:hypothetical protein
MLPRRIRHVLGLCLLAGALLLSLWGFWPPAEKRLAIDASSAPGAAGLPAGDYHLELVWPERLRAGDAGTIRATLVESGLDPQVHWTAEARLDLPGVPAEPGDTIQSPRLAEEPVAFAWTVRSRDPGRFSGRVWIFVQPVGGLSGSSAGEPGRTPLAALPVEVRVNRLAFLSGPASRAVGLIGIFAGLAWVLDQMVTYFRRRAAPRTHAG